MYETCPADDFTAVLRELDAAKALVRQRQEELNGASPVLPSHSLSTGLRIFETKTRKMNKATKRYLGAVGAFNLACRKGANPPREGLGPPVLAVPD